MSEPYVLVCADCDLHVRTLREAFDHQTDTDGEHGGWDVYSDAELDQQRYDEDPELPEPMDMSGSTRGVDR